MSVDCQEGAELPLDSEFLGCVTRIRSLVDDEDPLLRHPDTINNCLESCNLERPEIIIVVAADDM